MSYARSDEDGKDTLFFVTKEDSEKYTGEAEEKEESTGGQEEAYNEETGEINWDCPWYPHDYILFISSIAGMTKEPCGDKFKAAFSCFVYSKNEPKGSECIEQFKEMQECFKAHPDIYGKEIEDDENDENEESVPNQPEDVNEIKVVSQQVLI